MAKEGVLLLKAESMLQMYTSISTLETSLSEALYDQYKEAYKISLTNYMRGDSADAFKAYFTQGTINMISGMLELTSELTMLLQLATEAFYQFDDNSSAVIKESKLTSISEVFKGKESLFNTADDELQASMTSAKKYISVVSTESSNVNDEFSVVYKGIQSIQDTLREIDNELDINMGELLIRIQDMYTLVTSTMGLCYNDGNFDANSVDQMISSEWYSSQGNATLALMMAEDPFSYSTGEVTVSEDQWAAGLCSDVYAYAGYSFLSKSYEAGVENSTVFINASAVVFSLNGYAQLTDYLKAQGELKTVYVDVDAKAGFGDGYYGVSAKIEAGVISVDGSVVLGTDEFNGYIKGSAELLCADGEAAFVIEDDGEYEIGVKASATLAKASAKAGISFLSYEVDDGSATSENKDNLFELSAKASASAGGSFKLYSESQTAFEYEYLNINATSLEINAEALLGLELSITVPTIYWKLPW